MSTKRLRYANNLSASVAVARAVAGDYAALGGVQSFARALAALQVGSDARYSSVGVNVLRDQNYVGSTRTVLLEPAAKNTVLQACTMATAPWASVAGSPIQTNTPTPQTVAGITMSSSEDDSAVAVEGIGQNLTLVDGNCVFSVVLYPGTASVEIFRVVDVSAGPNRIRAQVNWSGGVPTISSLVGTQLGLDALPDGGYRLRISGSGIIGANVNALQLYPANTAAGDASKVGTSLAGAWQLEQENAYATTPIITTTVADTRPADALTLVGVPFSGTLFYHYYDLATAAWVSVAAAYTAGTAITPATGRAYYMMAVVQGTRTAAQCKAIIGGTFPA